MKMQFSPGSNGLLTPLNQWLTDASVSEILINQPGEVFIERLGHMQRFEVPLLDNLHLKRLFMLIANENNQVLNESNPMLSGNLLDGSRVQLVIPPAAKYVTLSIRRPSISQRSLDDYAQSEFYQQAKPSHLDADPTELLTQEDKDLQHFYQHQQWSDFIALAILAKKNIVISGETSSGKTTFLNACCQHIPSHERIITLEDTYEINLSHSNKVNLLASKNKTAPITMQDLVQCSLRLRPDRLIMGEIRGKEVLDFVSACTTGHAGSITSIHANNPSIAFMRMTQLYKLNNVPSMKDEEILKELHAVIDIIVQVRKKNDGSREMTGVYYSAMKPHIKNLAF